jgi:hypothetical protein
MGIRHLPVGSGCPLFKRPFGSDDEPAFLTRLKCVSDPEPDTNDGYCNWEQAHYDSTLSVSDEAVARGCADAEIDYVYTVDMDAVEANWGYCDGTSDEICVPCAPSDAEPAPPCDAVADPCEELFGATFAVGDAICWDNSECKRARGNEDWCGRVADGKRCVWTSEATAAPTPGSAVAAPTSAPARAPTRADVDARDRRDDGGIRADDDGGRRRRRRRRRAHGVGVAVRPRRLHPPRRRRHRRRPLPARQIAPPAHRRPLRRARGRRGDPAHGGDRQRQPLRREGGAHHAGALLAHANTPVPRLAH